MPLGGVHQAVHQAQPGHGVLGVADGRLVLRSDLAAGEAVAQRRAADQKRNAHAGFAQIGGGNHHLLRALDQQPRKPNGIGTVLAIGRDQIFGRNLDTQVDHRVAVVAEDDVNQVFADVVDVTLYRREDDFTPGRVLRFVHELFQVVHGRFHCLGRLQHLGDDQLVVVEQAAHLFHAVHQRTVNDVEGCQAFGALAFEVVDQPLFGALDDVVGQPFIERQVGDDFLGPRRGATEVLGDAGNMVLVDLRPLFGALLAVVARRVKALRRIVRQQILGEFLLLLGDGRVTLQLLGIHNRQIKPRLGGVIEEHRIDHLACGRGQPEANVAYAEHGLRAWQRLLDQPHGLDSLHCTADVVLVAGRTGEDQRIENEALLGEVPLLGTKLASPLGDGELSFACDGLRLLLVFIDRAHNHGRAKLLRQRQDEVEALFAVLEVDRVDDALTLAVGQRPLDRGGAGRIDHQRRFDLVDHLLVEAVDIVHLFAVGILEVDVDDLRTVLHLPAADLRSLFVLLVRNQPLEGTRADLVRALANQQRTVVVVRFDQLDAGVVRSPQAAMPPRLLALDHLRDGADVLGRGPAAAADEIEPTVANKALERGGQRRRRFQIEPVLVGQARVGIAGHPRSRHLVDGANVVGHKLGPRGAVEADREQVDMLEGCDQRVGSLPGQHRPHRLDRPRHHHRPLEGEFVESRVNADQSRLDVARVLAGFEQQQVNPAFQQPARLLVEVANQFIEGDAARDRNRLRRRAQRAGHETRARGRRALGGDVTSQLRRFAIDFVSAVFEAVLGEHDLGPAERVRFNDVRARVQVPGMDVANHIRAREHEVLVAAFEVSPAEILRGQLAILNGRAHRSVEHDDALVEQLIEELATIVLRHGARVSDGGA